MQQWKHDNNNNNSNNSNGCYVLSSMHEGVPNVTMQAKNVSWTTTHNGSNEAKQKEMGGIVLTKKVSQWTWWIK
jgi:hypothetical protein